MNQTNQTTDNKWFKISRKIDRVNEVIGKSAAHLTIVMVLVTFVVTVLRYVFNVGSIALQESILYFHSAVFLLAAAYTLRKGDHVRIDLFYHQLDERGKAKRELFGILFLLLPSMIFCLYISWDYVAISWSYFEGSREANGFNFVYILKSLLLVMPIMLIFQGIADLIRNILLLQGKISVEEWN